MGKPAYDYIPKDSEIPELYAQEDKGEEAIVYIKLFTPDANWTWYLTEYRPSEELAFGLVDGHEVELGYVSIAELKSIKGPIGLPIERDLYWVPKTIREVKESLEGRTDYPEGWGGE